jgi:hypothetical protein
MKDKIHVTKRVLGMIISDAKLTVRCQLNTDMKVDETIVTVGHFISWSTNPMRFSASASCSSA